MKIHPFLKQLALASAFLFCPSLAQDAPDYRESHRPQFHFSPAEHWMNDPNGLVYFDEEYHLFYQHNPFGTTWGHMSWGHAVSKDLVHWKHLPVALSEKRERMAFSGCVVVDKNNDSGLARGDDPVMIAIYTGYRERDGWQAQFLAYSQDRGRTWQDYSSQPILDISSTDFRDPNVFPYKGEWRMVIALPTERRVQIYSSSDLKSWTYLSEFGMEGAVGGAWECPDLFPMLLEGEERWILQVDLDRQAYSGGSGGQYFIGNFDGTEFTLDQSIPPQVFPDGRAVARKFEIEGQGLWKRADGECGSTRLASGTSRSESFEIDQDWLNFRISGGRHPGRLEARLRVDDKVVKRTTGFNGSPFQPVSWDVSPWRGKRAILELFDDTEELWGHLTLKAPTLSNRPATASKNLARWIDYGPDYYASISFHNMGERRVALGWMNNWLYGQDLPTSPWRRSMSVPRELSLKRIDGVLNLCQEPISELRSLRNRSGPTVQSLLANGGLSTTQLTTASGDLIISWKPGGGELLQWSLLGLEYTLDLESNELRFKREGAFHPSFPNETIIPIKKQSDEWNLRLLYDRSSVELFTQQGAVVHTARAFPKSSSATKISVSADKGRVKLVNWKMNSIWASKK